MIELRWMETGAGAICAEVLAELPEWFGMPEANEDYRQQAEVTPTLVAFDAEARPLGLLTVVEHSPHSAEVHLMAVRRDHHREGIGRELLAAAEARLRDRGIEYLQVKTLSASAASEEYERTREFYRATGFRILEEMPNLWDASNPAVVLVKRL